MSVRWRLKLPPGGSRQQLGHGLPAAEVDGDGVVLPAHGTFFATAG